MKTITAACIALALASTAAQAETGAERCENMAEYAEAVAIQRDQGVRLKEIKEINAERAQGNRLDAYNLTAAIVYRRAEIKPQDARKAILEGCLAGLR